MTAIGISFIGRFSMPHECDVQFSVRRRRSDDSSENEHIYIGQRFTMSHEGLAKNLEKTRSRVCPWRAQVVDDPRPSDEAADERCVGGGSGGATSRLRSPGGHTYSISLARLLCATIPYVIGFR
ncbi:hypothetical protein Q1695_000814 [Nippostrongylus brasiliensis]|nr:hypothetical protein Q1695_000814 [Nippostrongylus brasiliensis]